MFQTFDDRAEEVRDAIGYLKTRDDIDSSKIGMWGISQAGWVMPKVCASSPDVAFVIAVSVPVGTIAEQDVFRVRHTMSADGYTKEETESALEVIRRLRGLIDKRAPFDEALKLYREFESEPWGHFVSSKPTVDLYGFAKSLFALDKPPDVSAIKCPVLAVFGQKDMIVDVAESAARYTETLKAAGNDDVRVKVIPNANHGIALAETGGQLEAERMRESGDWRHAPGYLELMGRWLEARVG